MRSTGYVVRSWKTGLCEEKQIEILSRPSGLESMYTKTRPKVPGKRLEGRPFCSLHTKNLDFSRLQNEIRMNKMRYYSTHFLYNKLP